MKGAFNHTKIMFSVGNANSDEALGAAPSCVTLMSLSVVDVCHILTKPVMP